MTYGKTYRAEFEAVSDGERIKKRWKFTAKKFKNKLYTTTKRRTSINVKKGEQIVLFFEPRSNKDVLDCINYTEKLQITCYDQNTLLVIAPANRYFSNYTLKAGSRSVILHMK